MSTPHFNWVTDVLLDVERALTDNASARTLAALQHARAVAQQELMSPQGFAAEPHIRLAVDNTNTTTS